MCTTYTECHWMLFIIYMYRTNTDVDHELRLLRRTLMYSTAVLNADCSQFSTQLAGRLLPYITDSPETNNPNTQGQDK